MSSLEPDVLLHQIEAFLKDESSHPKDKDARNKLANAALKLHRTLEDPEDVNKRILIFQPVEGALINTALDLEIFGFLSEADQAPWTLEKLSKTTNTDPTLLHRLLRGLAAFGAIREVGGNTYALSPSHALFTRREYGHAVVSCAKILNPTYDALPGFLASKRYVNPIDPMDTAVQVAFGAGKTMMQILGERPKDAQGFGMLMHTWGEQSSLLQDVYPINENFGNGPGESDVLFVDVGGSYGQKAISLKQAHPDLKGRFVVQDLPGTVENATKVTNIPGIEFMAHDFTTEQPIKGARAYYIRQCLHNWPDEKCVTILSQLSAAMTGNSKLLIHELITPETGASVWQTTQDINMMAMCATSERTEKEWRNIIERAGGLKVSKIYYANDGISESVIECERA